MKKNIILIIIVIIVGLGFWFFQENEEDVNTNQGEIDETINSSVCSNENEDIVVNVGDEFIIALESNPTTGYSWMDEIKQDNISFIKKEFISEEDAEIVGAGGIEYFTYQAGEAGESDISFSYMRSWESVQPLEQKTFHIVVE